MDICGCHEIDPQHPSPTMSWKPKCLKWLYHIHAVFSSKNCLKTNGLNQNVLNEGSKNTFPYNNTIQLSSSYECKCNPDGFQPWLMLNKFTAVIRPHSWDIQTK